MGDFAAAQQRVRQNDSHWRVVTSAFHTVQLWMIIAVPEQPVLKPVEEFFLYATLCILGLAILMFSCGWLLSFQIRRPINRLVKDVRRLSNLENTDSIHIPDIKELRAMGEAIELLRQALEQHLHREPPAVNRSEVQEEKPES